MFCVYIYLYMHKIYLKDMMSLRSSTKGERNKELTSSL